jgi:hypothetical protein
MTKGGSLEMVVLTVDWHKIRRYTENGVQKGRVHGEGQGRACSDADEKQEQSTRTQNLAGTYLELEFIPWKLTAREEDERMDI